MVKKTPATWENVCIDLHQREKMYTNLPAARMLYLENSHKPHRSKKNYIDTLSYNPFLLPTEACTIRGYNYGQLSATPHLQQHRWTARTDRAAGEPVVGSLHAALVHCSGCSRLRPKHTRA